MPMSISELDRTYRRTYRRLIIAIFFVYGATLLVVLSLVIGNPRIASWVSDAAHSEMVGTNLTSPKSMGLAQPAKPIRTVKAE
jgi:hypothetical protein